MRRTMRQVPCELERIYQDISWPCNGAIIFHNLTDNNGPEFCDLLQSQATANSRFWTEAVVFNGYVHVVDFLRVHRSGAL